MGGRGTRGGAGTSTSTNFSTIRSTETSMIRSMDCSGGMSTSTSFLMNRDIGMGTCTGMEGGKGGGGALVEFLDSPPAGVP